MAKLMAMSRHEGRLPSQLVAQVVRLRYQASWTLRAAQIRRLFTPLRKSRRSLGARSSSQVQVLSAHVLRLSDGGTCTEARLSLQWTLPGGAQQVGMTLLKGLLTPKEVEGLLLHVPEHFDLDRADVEMVPKRWIMLERAGRPVPQRELLVEKMRPYIEGRLLPYLRAHLGCPSCVVCSSIMRRYSMDLGERYRDPPHTDGQAFATVVIALNSAGRDYEGGLYVVSDPWRPLTVSLAGGDAVIHRWDLQHGVEVTSGRRLSWILWLQDQAPCVTQVELHQRSFLQSAAEDGNVVAMQILGTGENGRSEEGQRWLRMAAEAGLSGAMAQLAKHLREQGQEAEALQWLQHAAGRGDAGAQSSLGMMLLQRGQLKEAEEWLEEAAELGNPVAQHDLGMALYTNALGRRDRRHAAFLWLERAARQGHAMAQSNLAVLCAENQDFSQALYWWNEAGGPDG
ncbi:unnamed protein product [Durusdinium trenchii]|uniref:Fe2OG dioxygenase domain-containing protein n=1 Tax=Durusdinium trenchii TaxID=1381693 RepID=A0ABP0NAD5_9DINO